MFEGKMVAINAIVYDLTLKYEEAHLRTEKLDLKNERFRVECYDLNVGGFGRTLEDAEEDFLRRLKTQVDIIRNNGNAELLTGKWASERCKKSLEKIMLSKKRIIPDIKYIDNFEVHFYNDFGDFE